MDYQYRAIGLNGVERHIIAVNEIEAMKLAKSMGLVAPVIGKIKSRKEELQESDELWEIINRNK